jgi:hypothetical protein
MDRLFSRIALADTHEDLFRNVVSLFESQNLFDDLSSAPDEWRLAQQVEADARPLPYRSHQPEIDRPFEDSVWYNAIRWPFRNWQESRFSDGSFGVWYGSDRIYTTIYETMYHWYRGLVCDAGFEQEQVTIERRVFRVACNALLLDFRQAAEAWPAMLHPADYTFTQLVGARVKREGHPGILTLSVRHHGGLNYAIMNPHVLSRPRHHSYLRYQLRDGSVSVDGSGGILPIEVAVESFG